MFIGVVCSAPSFVFLRLSTLLQPSRPAQSMAALPPSDSNKGAQVMALAPIHDAKETRLGVNTRRDGFPHGVAVALGLVVTFVLAFFAIVVFGGFP